MKQYKKIALGGTFDHFHKGHQLFLMAAGELADQLLIGVTTPEMLHQKKLPELIESYEQRAETVRAFTKNLFVDAQIVPLNDQYGPTLQGSSVEAIVVTSDTEAGAKAINTKRAELGLTELPIHIVELATDADGGVISSDRIRAGEINRAGEVYASIFVNDLTISDTQRTFFSKPQGEIVQKPSAATMTFVVGDMSLATFQKHSWQYDLAVIDQKIQRQSYSPPILSEEVIDATVKNPAGIITRELVMALLQGIKEQHKHLLVDGEEDLAAVALVLLTPLQSHIYYGQPNQGTVEIIVSEQLKETIKNVLQTV